MVYSEIREARPIMYYRTTLYRPKCKRAAWTKGYERDQSSETKPPQERTHARTDRESQRGKLTARADRQRMDEGRGRERKEAEEISAGDGGAKEGREEGRERRQKGEAPLILLHQHTLLHHQILLHICLFFSPAYSTQQHMLLYFSAHYTAKYIRPTKICDCTIILRQNTLN